MKQSHKKRDINTYYRHNADGNPPCEKKVLCVETNIIYRSIAAAARELNLKETHISRVLRGYRKTTGGYHWEYVNYNNFIFTILEIRGRVMRSRFFRWWKQ